MIVVGGSFEVAPEDRDEFLAGRVELMRRSRAEEGCVEYVFAADPVEPGRVVLYERWESQAALDAHFAVLRSEPLPTGDVVPTATSITLYDVSGERTLV